MKKAICRGVWVIWCLTAMAVSAEAVPPIPDATDIYSGRSVPAATASASRKRSTPSSIVMATDKMHYVRAEMVKLKGTNSLDIPIWYIGYPQHDLVFWEIERAQDNGWKRLDFRLPIIEGGIEVCRITLYERPVGAVTELKPHSDLLYEWNQKICKFKIVTKPLEPEMIERGKYRFALRYSLDTVKSEDIKTKPWERPIDLDETKIVYSNEFVLE